MDIVDPTSRSRMMAGIRAKNTRPEILVRRALHSLGYRFRLHRRDLPGSPDLVLPRHNAVIYVNGCFWHHHEGCSNAKVPSTRREFWQKKLMANRSRDQRNQAAVETLGWRVAVIWECALRHDPKAAVDKLDSWLRRDENEIGEHLQVSGIPMTQTD